MSYELAFLPAAKLHSQKDRYQIKLHDMGFRLVYQVQDEVLTVLVVAVSKRDRDAVYRAAAKR